MSDKETTTFHNEDAIFRIAMWSNIIAWIALGLSVLQFSSVAYDLYTQWEGFIASVPELFQRAAVLGRVLFLEPFTGGVFAFLVLRGLSQGLYLAMDYTMGDEADDE